MTFSTGFNRANKVGNNAANGGLTVYRMQNGVAQALYSGDPVKVSGGYVQLATNTDAASTRIGVVEKFAYIDGTTGKPVESNIWPASTSVGNGVLYGYNMESGGLAFVADDPDELFYVQAQVSIPQSSMGALAMVTAAGTGSSYTKRSLAKVDITGTAVSADNSLVRIMGVVQFDRTDVSAGTTPGGTYTNKWDSPQTWVVVKLQKHMNG